MSSAFTTGVLLALLACSAAAGAGQEFRATLTGRVVDAALIGIPGVTLTVRHLDRAESFTAVTRDDGMFTIPFLNPGTYIVETEPDGFERYASRPIEVGVGATVTLAVSLRVRGVTESVEVAPEPIDATKADRGLLIDNQRVSELPLNGRNPFMLAALSPGVTFNGQQVFQRPFDNGSIADWSINGGLNRNNDFLLDGAPNNAIHTGNNIAYVPPVDAVQEFKVVSNGYDAQYGRTGGGVINVSLKSGTNTLRGAAYEFARRPAWDATSVLEKSQPTPMSGHTLDQFGIEVDGPVRWDGLYDGRNRTFFMVAVEGYRERTPSPVVLTVPDALQREGNFSQLRDESGNLIVIYDPDTGRVENGRWVRDAFPGNIIPPDRISGIARTLVASFPEPNTTGGPDPWRSNFAHTPNLARDTFYNVVAKVDHGFAGSRAFVRYAMNHRTELRTRNGIGSGPARDGQLPLERINHALVGDWVRPLGTSLLLNVRVSTNTYVQDARTEEALGFDATRLGFPAQLAASLPQAMFPRINVADYSFLGRGSTQRLPTRVIAAQPNVTILKGTHAVRAGADTRWTWYAPEESGFAGMRLDFDRTFTRADFSRADDPSGNSIASLLLGAPVAGVIDNNLLPQYRWTYYAPWIQDDWRVTSRLTLNLGLRWDFTSPVRERQGRLNAGFDPLQPNPVSASIDAQAFREYAALSGGLRFADGNGNGHRYDWNNIQPRAGFVYAQNSRTVVRGGFGRSFLNPTTVGTSHGYSVQTALVGSNDGNRTPLYSLQNPFPVVAQPEGSARGPLTLLGRSPTFSNPGFDIPLANHFSIGIHRELPWRTSVEATYAGSRTSGAPVAWTGYNEPAAEFRALCDPTAGGDPGYCNERVGNPFFGRPGFEGTRHGTSQTLSRYDLARPFPHFAAFSELDRNDGRVRYDSLQLVANRRFGSGFTLSGSYTLSKATERMAFMDDVTRSIDSSPSAADRRHRAVLSAVYHVPATGGVLAPLLRGWQLSGVWILQSGRPWELPANVFVLGDPRDPSPHASRGLIRGVLPCVGDFAQDGTVVLRESSVRLGCAEAFFVVRPPFAARTTALRSADIRLPGFRQLDLGLARTIRIAGSARLQVRAELFNVFNEAMYDERQYVNDPGNAAFGTINKGVVPQSNFPRQLQLAVKLLF
jgi:hypothetical protein